MDWLKAEDCWGKAYFKALFDASITFRQSMAIVLSCTIQPSI